ncbi:hypothetical protein ACLKA6_008462 [Drosophila palustris]
MSGFYQPIPGEESARLFPFNADVSTRIHVQIAEASEKTLPSTEQHKNTLAASVDSKVSITTIWRTLQRSKCTRAG